MTTFDPLIVSDTHFKHRRIIEYCDRPFHSVGEMNECLIHNWNSITEPHDTVYHLGDVGFGDLSEFQGRLNGTVHLIQGNHDSSTTWNTFSFASRQQHLIIQCENLRILLIHYPIHTEDFARQQRPNHANWDVCLYGHVHNRRQGWETDGVKWYRNCSVEVHDYTPQRLSKLLVDCPAKL
jgi:calcineurin-like phosphoesterase family protein